MIVEWKQRGQKVYFDYYGEEIYFIMPKGVKIKEVHPDLIKLAEFYMLSPFHEIDLNSYNFTRKQGKGVGLNFSAGIDSTANMILLPPNTHLMYTERHGIDDCILDQDNAFRMIRKIKQKVIQVKTNFEIIRAKHGLAFGYSTGIGMGVPLILLADFLDLGYISYGKVFDDHFFPKGVYRPHTKDWKNYEKWFRSAGIPFILPTVGCTEVITTKIVDNSEYKDWAFSCLRGHSGKQCNNCYKCFRKNLLRNKEARLDNQSQASISKDPPKMAPSLMYALKLRGLRLKEVEEFYDLETGFLDKYLPEAYGLQNDLERHWIETALNLHGIEKMNESEVARLKALSFQRKGPTSK